MYETAQILYSVVSMHEAVRIKRRSYFIRAVIKLSASNNLYRKFQDGLELSDQAKAFF